MIAAAFDGEEDADEIQGEGEGYGKGQPPDPPIGPEDETIEVADRGFAPVVLSPLFRTRSFLLLQAEKSMITVTRTKRSVLCIYATDP